MTLNSKFLRNAQLRNCELYDASHISEVSNAKGDWVPLIKEALNAWAARQKPPLTPPLAGTEIFDQATGDRVAEFKRRHSPPILNSRGEIDRIVGKKTVVALDDELPRLGEAPIQPKPPLPSDRYVNQPRGERFLIASVKHDLYKPDLDYSRRPLVASAIARARVAADSSTDTSILEQKLHAEMEVGGGAGLLLFNAWKTNNSVTERNFPLLDSEVAATPAFLEMARKFEARVTRNLNDQYCSSKVDYHDLVTGDGPIRSSFKAAVPERERGKATGRMLSSLEPPLPALSLTSDRVVKICVGSFQAIDVFISNFRVSDDGKAAFTLKYVLRDHFGVDDNDCEMSSTGLHGTPGQIAMWILQHHRRPGHVPFITLVEVEREVAANLVAFG